MKYVNSTPGSVDENPHIILNSFECERGYLARWFGPEGSLQVDRSYQWVGPASGKWPLQGQDEADRLVQAE